jgi:hypothetical protein
MAKLNLRSSILALAASVTVAGIVGCSSSTPSTPVSRVPVPSLPEEGPVKSYAPLRPLREPTPQELVPPPAFDDVPLVTQALPEEPAYLAAYGRVGKPRVAVFVNRSIDGELIPADERRPAVSIEVTRESNAAVDTETTRKGWYGDHRTDRFKSDGPAQLRETAAISLAPGDYDDAQARAIDYQAIELALTDALAAGGKVTLVSPMMARQRLSDDEVKDLQSGRRVMLREIVEKLDVDVLIQAQARPTKQTAQGLEVRVLVEAINTRGGESVARAFVDVPSPMEKTTINRYTRLLARRTMAELANNWSAMASERPASASPNFDDDAPATRPAGSRPTEPRTTEPRAPDQGMTRPPTTQPRDAEPRILSPRLEEQRTTPQRTASGEPRPDAPRDEADRNGTDTRTDTTGSASTESIGGVSASGVTGGLPSPATRPAVGMAPRD